MRPREREREKAERAATKRDRETTGEAVVEERAKEDDRRKREVERD